MKPINTLDYSLLERTEAWTEYWSSQALHSMKGSYEGNYSGAIAAFWQRVFALLPPKSSVLEVCSGNAALSKMLIDSDWCNHVATITATDLAHIAPNWIDKYAAAELPKFTLLPNQDLHELPLTDEQFTLCMSQYGLEYTQSRALEQCARVLKPKGYLAAVLHHPNSLLVEIAKNECGQQKKLLQPGGLIDRIEAIEPYIRMANDLSRRHLLHNNREAEQARTDLNNILEEMRLDINKNKHAAFLVEQYQLALQFIEKIPTYKAEQNKLAFQQWRNHLVSALLRQQEMIEFARTEQDLRSWFQSFHGELLELQPLYHTDKRILGWGLIAQRSA